jgi:sterol desaturase/sphingolipid hydroxylase (fatty acid hydroxylase superfamily)
MEHEALIRMAVFAGVFAAMAGWEVVRPDRAANVSRPGRWLTNWGVFVIDILVTRLLFPAAAVGAALDAAAGGWGLFNHLDWPIWVEVLLVVIALDFAIWLQHLLSHKIPILWRLHRVHHTDRDVDVTTALRFHPIEIALSMLFKIGLVYALGAAALAVILFEIILNGMAMFNHANIRLPGWAERPLRWLVVTPQMHRIHHSVDPRETDSNYGFNLSLWDRGFGTYSHAARAGEGFTLGLSPYQDARPTKLGWSLALPFLGRSR